MSQTIRCKFTVSSVTTYQGGNRKVTLAPQYDQSIEEDRRFSKYTPSGSLEMLVDNPNVIDALQLGKTFYIDLTPVE